MTDARRLTLACLLPDGRARKNAELAYAHHCGRLFAERGAILVSDGARGETADAFATGVSHGGGRLKVPVAAGSQPPRYPAPVEIVPIESEIATWLGQQADGVVALAPGVSDLDRYFATWLAALGKPAICVAPGSEFRLIRGMVDEIVRPRRGPAAQKMIFAASPEQAWDALQDLLSEISA
jgi:hypothetical protein